MGVPFLFESYEGQNSATARWWAHHTFSSHILFSTYIPQMLPSALWFKSEWWYGNCV